MLGPEDVKTRAQRVLGAHFERWWRKAHPALGFYSPASYMAIQGGPETVGLVLDAISDRLP